MYNRDRMTLTAIAAEIDVGPDAVADLARKYGIVRTIARLIPKTLTGCTKTYVVQQL